MDPFSYLKKKIHRHEFHGIAKRWILSPTLIDSLSVIYGQLRLPVPVTCTCLMGQPYDRCTRLLLAFRSQYGTHATWQTLITALKELNLNDESDKLKELAKASTGPSLWSIWSNVTGDRFRCEQVRKICIVFGIYVVFTGFLGWFVWRTYTHTQQCAPTPGPAVSAGDLMPSPRACSGLGDFDVKFDLENSPTQLSTVPSTSSNIQYLFHQYGLSVTAFMFTGRMVSGKKHGFNPGDFYIPTTLPNLRTLGFSALSELDSLHLFEIFMTLELPQLRTIALVSVTMSEEDHVEYARKIIQNTKSTLQLLVLLGEEHQEDSMLCSILTDDICNEMRPGFRIVGDCADKLTQKCRPFFKEVSTSANKIRAEIEWVNKLHVL